MDAEENLVLLTSFKDWLVQCFKKREQGNKDKRNNLKDILLKGIKIEIIKEDPLDNLPLGKDVTVNDKVVYYICGYLYRSFARSRNSCALCCESMNWGFEDLPENFNATDLTKFKTKGGLKFCSTAMFELMSRVEFYFLDFCITGDVFKADSFGDLLYTICVEELPRVGCDSHYLNLMSNLIYD